MGKWISGRVSCRRPDGTSHEDNRFVVAGVPVAAGRAFDVFDSRVVGLDLACCCAGDGEDFDLVPPPAGRAVELVGLWPSCCFNQDLEIIFRHGGVSQRVGAQQRPELLFDLSHGLELAGRVAGGEDPGQAVCGRLGERVAGGQEQHPVGPALSIMRPRRPLTCWDRFCRASVTAWLARETRWK
jgi:hypothetical protein